MTFIKQTKKYNCGPTAIYNLLLFLGIKYPVLSRITIQSGCTEAGTSPEGISNALDKSNDTLTWEHRTSANLPTTSELKSHVSKEDNAAILLILAGRLPGNITKSHYILCIDSDEDTFTVINDTKDIEKIPNIWMHSYLTHGIKEDIPEAWLIKKKE